MALNQINLKVDNMLYEHIQKKSIRNKISNQEYLKKLVKDDFNAASEGDLELLNRYGEWATKKIVQKLEMFLPEKLADILKNSEDKSSKSLQEFSQEVQDDFHLLRSKIKENRNFVSATYSVSETIPDLFKKGQKQSEVLYRNQLLFKKFFTAQLVALFLLLIFQIKEVFL